MGEQCKLIDITGQKFGEWTVLGRSDQKDNRGNRMWVAQCSCGCILDKTKQTLRKQGGRCKKCADELYKLKHGHMLGNKPTKTYSSWQSMRHRFLDESYPDIEVCDRWTTSFEAFLEDMGERPPGTTIDRIDGTKGYFPGNCRWATPTEQNRNRGKYNRYLTLNGESKTISEWAQIYDMSDSTLRFRIRRGWDPIRAVTTPSKRRYKYGKTQKI